MITAYEGLKETAKDETGEGLEGHAPHHSLSLSALLGPCYACIPKLLCMATPNGLSP